MAERTRLEKRFGIQLRKQRQRLVLDLEGTVIGRRKVYALRFALLCRQRGRKRRPGLHEAIAVYQVVGIVRRSDELDIIDDLPQIVHFRLE